MHTHDYESIMHTHDYESIMHTLDYEIMHTHDYESIMHIHTTMRVLCTGTSQLQLGPFMSKVSYTIPLALAL